MTLSALTPYLYHLSDLLLLPASALTLAFHLFLPWMLGCTVLICLGVEMHYQELTRRAAEEAVTYTSISAPVERGPIWEAVQPGWRGV